MNVPEAPSRLARAEENARRRRQGRIVLGIGLVILAGAAFLLAPDLTTPLVRDLPFIAVGAIALFAGGALLGAGAAGRPPRTRAR